MNSFPVIEIQNLYFSFRNKKPVLIDLNLTIFDGELVTILGANGSGKTTLLKCINRLLTPKEGNLHVLGTSVLLSSPTKLRQLRKKIAMIPQDNSLIENMSVLDNVLIGRLSQRNTIEGVLGLYTQKDIKFAQDCLESLGISNSCHEKVSHLSGGQRQKVALARALAQEPRIILADEPFSNLDPRVTNEIMKLLRTICLDMGISLVIILHDINTAKKYTERIVGISNGRVIISSSASSFSDRDFSLLY